MLPIEKFDNDWQSELRLLESRWCARLFMVMPLLVVILVLFLSRVLLWVLYLQPIQESIRWSDLFEVKAMIPSLGIVGIPVFWWCGIRLEKVKQKKLWATVLLVLFIVNCNGLFMLGNTRWFFVEWAKVRTPNPSFARNTLFWEQRNFETSPQCGKNTNQKKLQLVGSSQIYQATDLHLLGSEADHVCAEKNCLAGFGPIQYQFLLPRIAERKPDLIVCWLSEFDFFREKDIPINRLRWASSPGAVVMLTQQLDNHLIWKSRGELADLSLAACAPLWRNRDHLKRTLLNYWWNRSGSGNQQTQQVDVLAQSAGLEQAINYMKKNVHRSRMLEVNFRCFEQFAHTCEKLEIDLIVFEGQSHPLASRAYDASFKRETRTRLTELSRRCGYQYYDQSQIPQFTSEEFSDAYHLNTQGQKRWTKFLAQTLNQSHR